VESPILSPQRSRVPSIDTQRRASFDTHVSVESMLVKQGKQIRALYELQKKTLEKVELIQNQIKNLTGDKNTDLSSKVFGVSNSINLITIYYRCLTTRVICRYITNTGGIWSHMHWVFSQKHVAEFRRI
jgi:hypothetical protein